jgi:hypothetical protein
MTEEQATEAVARAMFPSAEWENPNLAWVECPGIDLHTNSNGKRDCRLTINDGMAPTLHCCHASCSQVITDQNFAFRSSVGKLKSATGNQIKKAGLKIQPVSSKVSKPQATEPKVSQKRVLAPMAPPSGLDDPQRKHLEALFRTGELVSIVFGKGELGKPMSGGTTRPMEDAVEPHDNGTFIRVNPMKAGGTGDADVTAWRHCLIEMDKAPLDLQWAAIVESKLPISAVVFSGKRSYHALVRVDASTADEFRERARVAADRMEEFQGIEIDRSALNPSRLSRLAGCQRGDAVQTLIATEVGSGCWDDFLANTKLQEPEVESPTVEESAAKYSTPIEFFYRHKTKDFLMLRDGEITPLNEGQVKMALRQEDMVENDRDVLEAAVWDIMTNAGVHYDGSLPGYCLGVHIEGGKRYLCDSAATWLEGTPHEGELGVNFPTIWALLQGLLGIGEPSAPDYNKAVVRLLWSLKVSRESLKAALRPPSATSKRQVRPGQATVFCGPKNCGKSLIVNHIITPLLGGRMMDAHKAFASGSEGFNGELLSAEVWTVDDKVHANDLKSRKQFASSIKSWLYSGSVGFHPKFKEQITIKPWARLFIMCNDEPEAIRVLPPLTSDIDDKLHLFRCTNGNKLSTSTMEDYESYSALLASELPAFAGAVDAIEIPERQRCQRNGIKSWHDPHIVRLLAEQTPENGLAHLLSHAMSIGVISKQLKLGAMGILDALRASEDTKWQARNLTHDDPAILGRYLARMTKVPADQQFGIAVELSGKRHNSIIYKISLQEGGGMDED